MSTTSFARKAGRPTHVAVQVGCATLPDRSPSHRCRRDAGRCPTAGRSSVRWLVALALACVIPLAHAQALYRIKPIGSLGGCDGRTPQPTDFNEKGQVTGQACTTNSQLHAFLWKNDGTPMIDLGPSNAGTDASSIGYALNEKGVVAGTVYTSTGKQGFISAGGAPMAMIVNTLGGQETDARDINDLGVVTGNAETDNGLTHPFIWKSGTPMQDLGVVDPNFPEGAGQRINNAGQVVGAAGDGDRSSIAIIWNNDGSPLQAIPRLGGYTASPCCLNAQGQVAGSASVSGFSHSHAFFWRNDGSPVLDLGTFAQDSNAQSSARGLNDAGQVTGWAYTHWSGRLHAFVWLNNGTPIKDLGTFGGTTSIGNDINSSGQVTGYANLAGDTARRAFLWRNDGTAIKNLATLIDPLDPLRPFITLTAGLFINNQGNILAEGVDSRTGRTGIYHLQGTVITLTPRALAFGQQPINTTSAAKTVTVKNTSGKAVAITTIALAGRAAGQFGYTHNCPKSLAGFASCAVRVVFKPTTKGAKSAVLNVNGGGGGLRTTTLTGTGT